MIVRDVNNGYLLRYIHANGVSIFFKKVYVHIGKGLYYGSYRAPRTALWIVGVLIFIVKKATAFIGYHGRKWYVNMRNLIFLTHFFSFYRSLNYKSFNPLDLGIRIYTDLDKKETISRIKIENKRKAGIYGIYNKNNNKLFIGYAISNHIYREFNRHIFLNSGDINIHKDIKTMGINNFNFIIFEYYPSIIIKEDSKFEHLQLIKLFNYWIKYLNPSYNSESFDKVNINKDLANLAIKKYNNLTLIETQKMILEDNHNLAGIYVIYNNLNNKFFIGSSAKNIYGRFNDHCINEKKGNILVRRAINKYGLSNFTFMILEYYPYNFTNTFKE
jgi:hypothetical protein